jgi:hypothetical protein
VERVKIPVVSEASESTLPARVDVTFVGVSFSVIDDSFLPIMCCVCCYLSDVTRKK